MYLYKDAIFNKELVQKFTSHQDSRVLVESRFLYININWQVY